MLTLAELHAPNMNKFNFAAPMDLVATPQLDLPSVPWERIISGGTLKDRHGLRPHVKSSATLKVRSRSAERCFNVQAGFLYPGGSEARLKRMREDPHPVGLVSVLLDIP